MDDRLFARAYSWARRVAAVRSAAAKAFFPSASREDLEQQVMIAVWLAISCYDPARASLRTFVERVAANRMASLLRSLHHSLRHREVAIEEASALAAPDRRADLRADVSQVLAGVSTFDRRIARSLTYRSAAETSRSMGVSRSKVYRAIERLRAAFTEAGLYRRGRKHGSRTEQPAASE